MSGNSITPSHILRILLVSPVPLFEKDGALYVDEFSIQLLNLWAEHFDEIVFAGPTLPPYLTDLHDSTTWIDTGVVAHTRFVPLPWSYPATAFLSSYRRTRTLLEKLIGEADILHFVLGSHFDWSNLAALTARRLDRPYCAYIDRLEVPVIIEEARRAGGWQMLKAAVKAPVIQAYRRAVVSSSALTFLNGEDCYQEYSRFAPTSYLIEDFHLDPADGISASDLAAKLDSIRSAARLRIMFVGRMHAMKGPLDWVRAIKRATDGGANLEAVWVGGGALRDEMTALIESLDLEDTISLRDKMPHQEALRELRQAHMLLATLTTRHSARILIDAVVSGTPLIGYDSLFMSRLQAEYGGNEIVPLFDWSALGDLLVQVDGDRERIARLARAAAERGRAYDGQALIRERALLLKRHLLPAETAGVSF